MMDAVEQHRLVCEGKLHLCLDPDTLQPGLLDPITKIWEPTSDEFNHIQTQAYEAAVDWKRERLRRQHA
jgi:hypothetical protein